MEAQADQVPGGSPPPGSRWLLPAVRGESELWSLPSLIRTLILSWGSILMASSTPVYFPKATLPNTVTLWTGKGFNI